MRIRDIPAAAAIGLVLGLTTAALAANFFPTPTGETVAMSLASWLNASSQAIPVSATNPLPVTNQAAAGGAGFPTGAVPVQNTLTGTTAVTAAALPAAAGKFTYICGFTYTGTNATAANTATAVTVTGITTPLSWGFTTLAAAATVPNNPPLTVAFSPCQPSSAVNTAVSVNGPALGAGATFSSVATWGYQL